MSHILELRSLTVRFGQKVVLHNVHLNLPDRGVVTLMGPGGSGKSTLLRLIEGSLQRSSTVEIEGMFVPGWEESRVSVVHQRLTRPNQSVFDWLADALPNRSELTRLQQREFIEAMMREREQGDLVGLLGRSVILLEATEVRRLSVFRALLTDPQMLCVDETTTGFEGEELERFLNWIAAEGLRRAVLFVTHNQQHARAVADYSALLAAGQLIEFGPAMQFFEAPTEPLTEHFLRTGGVPVTSPNYQEEEEANEATAEEGAQPEIEALELEEVSGLELIDEVEVIAPDPPPLIVPVIPIEITVQPSARGPRGFNWLRPGALAGTPKPGIVAPTEYDVVALRQTGVTHLVTLTELPHEHLALMREAGLQVIHFPIVDMEAPPVERAFELCQQIEVLINGGFAVAHHCKAGLGRTGTMLAAQLVFEGLDAEAALAQVRSVEGRWVQSRTQEKFLVDFQEYVQKRRTRPQKWFEMHDLSEVSEVAS